MSRSRAAALAVLAISLVVGIVSVREVAAGRTEIGLSDVAAQKSDWPLSIAHARAAAEALAPGSPWPERGWTRLEALGHDAEARGDDETALLAYGAMRTAALATRGPLSGWQSRRAQAEEGLARVAASDRDRTARSPSASSMLDALHDTEPPTTWVLCALAGAGLAMVAGVARLAWLGPDAGGARISQGVAAVGLLAYAAMTLAQC